MLDRKSQYEALRSPLSPLSGGQINMTDDETPPSYAQAHSLEALNYKDSLAAIPPVMYLFKQGWASGMQRDAEINLIKGEAVLQNLYPLINNLNRLRDNENQQPEEQSDKQSIFSRLSQSSRMSRKVSSSCSRQRLKMMIAADKISIQHSFIAQARSQIKHQQGYIRRAASSGFTARDAEMWLDGELATPNDMHNCQFIGSRQVRYLERPAKKGYALLCQTKAYKNAMREQEGRMLHIEKALRDLQQSDCS